MDPLTDTEKAYFDTIKAVSKGPRHTDLQLWRMELDGEPVAVISQRVIDGETATTVGFQPLAMLLDDERIKRLVSSSGSGPESVDPDGLEGAA